MNVLSAFDGMSGGQIALNKANVNFDNYFASEIKSHGIKVTQHNYPNTIQLGDITRIDSKNLPKIDVLIGGSPCQNFSNANKTRLGLDGVKSGLFYEYLRLLEETNPKYFFLENVKMNEKDSNTISNYLGVKPININSKLVSAQLRNRFYWTNIPFDGIIDRKILLQDILEEGYTDREKSRCLLESDSRPLTTPVKMFHRYYSTGFTTIVFKNEQHYLDCVEHYDKHFKDNSAKEIFTTTDVYNGLRYLNQTELELLQTVPFEYTSVVNRNDASSLLGDGWTVDIIVEFFKNLK